MFIILGTYIVSVGYFVSYKQNVTYLSYLLLILNLLFKLKNHCFLNIVVRERFSSFWCQESTLEDYPAF
jgi:hypothetical protein